MTLCVEPAGMNARVYWRETEDDDDPRQGWYWVEVDDEGNARERECGARLADGYCEKPYGHSGSCV